MHLVDSICDIKKHVNTYFLLGLFLLRLIKKIARIARMIITATITPTMIGISVELALDVDAVVAAVVDRNTFVCNTRLFETLTNCI